MLAQTRTNSGSTHRGLHTWKEVVATESNNCAAADVITRLCGNRRRDDLEEQTGASTSSWSSRVALRQHERRQRERVPGRWYYRRSMHRFVPDQRVTGAGTHILLHVQR